MSLAPDIERKTVTGGSSLRHDWTREEVREIFALPFPDLMHEAQRIHRLYFDPREVQISTLLSIKTGGCPEDCAYCPQSAGYATGVKAEKLMRVDAVLADARAALLAAMAIERHSLQHGDSLSRRDFSRSCRDRLTSSPHSQRHIQAAPWPVPLAGDSTVSLPKTSPTMSTRKARPRLRQIGSIAGPAIAMAVGSVQAS